MSFFISYKCYILIELIILKEFMLMSQVNQNSVPLLCFLDKGFKFQAHVCNRCHDVLIMSMNLSNIAVITSNGVDYHCSISRNSKSKENMQNINLSEKRRIL